MFLYEVCSALKRAKIPYAVVGGYAVALHGAVRGTVDIDVAIVWTLKNLKAAETALNAMGLVSLLPINAENLYHFRDEYIKNRNMIAWNFYDPKNPSRQVDIVISYDLKQAHVDTIRIADGNISVLSRADLIAMKKASGRSQDIEDAKTLESL